MEDLREFQERKDELQRWIRLSHLRVAVQEALDSERLLCSGRTWSNI